MAEPRIYSRLYDVRTDGLRAEVEQRLSSEASKAAHGASGWVAEAIREAYVRGVSDGFAQGVAREVEPSAQGKHG